MSPTRVAKLQKKVQYCHTCCRKLQGDCTGADQVERRADILGRQGQVATPAAFYLGLCRLRGNLSLPAPATIILQAGYSSLPQRLLQAELQYFATKKIGIGRGTVATTTAQAGYSTCRNDGTAVIPDFRPRIGNRCSKEVKTRAILALIPDFKPRLENRCSQKVKTRAIIALILDFKPRLSNRCAIRSKQGQSVHRFLISSPDLRIDAAIRSKQGQSVHRFSNSAQDLRIDAAKKLNLGQTVQRFLISGPDLRIDAAQRSKPE